MYGHTQNAWGETVIVENWAVSQALVKPCQITSVENLLCKLGLTLASFGAELKLLSSVQSQQREICTFGMRFIWLIIDDVCIWRRWLILNSTWGSIGYTGWLSVDYKGTTGWSAQIQTCHCRYLHFVRWPLPIMSKDISQNLM